MRTTIKEALATFDLIAGPGSESTHQACAMSLLAWLDECDQWTDQPLCAHPLVADQVIRANDDDGTTKAMRARLVRLGVKGVLDTWWIPVEVIAAGLAGERGEKTSQYDRTVRLLQRLAAWKLDRQRPNLGGANLGGADLGGADLRGADLQGANLQCANLKGANLSGADLGGADLGGANLRGANLVDADLVGAYGTPSTGTPVGWKLVNGFWQKADS